MTQSLTSESPADRNKRLSAIMVERGKLVRLAPKEGFLRSSVRITDEFCEIILSVPPILAILCAIIFGGFFLSHHFSWLFLANYLITISLFVSATYNGRGHIANLVALVEGAFMLTYMVHYFYVHPLVMATVHH